MQFFYYEKNGDNRYILTIKTDNIIRIICHKRGEKMSLFKKKEKIIEEKINQFNESLNNYIISPSLDVNVMIIKQLFIDNDTIISRSVVNNFDKSLQFYIIYREGMVDPTIISETIIKQLVLSNADISKNNLLDSLVNQVLITNETRKISSMKEVIENVCYGDTVLFVNGCDKALVLDTKKFQTRAIEEPQNEKALNGPKEGFNEYLLTNLSLISRKLKTNDLKMKYLYLGQKTNTKCCICYLDSIVNKQVLEELYSRLDKIDIDGIIDANYINESIKDSPYSLFQTMGFTEKPDVVAANLLEGKIAIIIDGSPIVITIPYFFVENFQNSDDYYVNFYYACFTRIIRMFGFFLAITVPAFYISIVAYHHEMIPTSLFINVTLERQSVPMPAAAEAIIMLLLFDILKETGVRMPTNIGHALSIVGALVIGQSAVEAKLVAAPMIIVVALTGITSLLVPKMNAGVIYLRYVLLFLSIILGFYGFILGLACILIHILNLRSFGIPQLTLGGKTNYQAIKDTLFRGPWSKMKLRPKLVTDNQQRMKGGNN